MREFAGAVLNGAGYQVVTAGDGEEALAKLRRDTMQFDAVLLDLTMPKLDGEDTLMAMRMISANISARGMTGIFRRRASTISGFSGRTADETTTTSAAAT